MSRIVRRKVDHPQQWLDHRPQAVTVRVVICHRLIGGRLRFQRRSQFYNGRIHASDMLERCLDKRVGIMQMQIFKLMQVQAHNRRGLPNVRMYQRRRKLQSYQYQN